MGSDRWDSPLYSGPDCGNETLSEGIGRSVRNDIRKDTSGGAENVLARGECDIVGLNKCSSDCINSFRRNHGFDH